MRYALIGCGRIAINHLLAANKNNLDIVGLCDLIPEHIDLLKNKCNFDTSGTKKYQDYRQMIEEQKPDLISIATESGKHAEIAKYCIENSVNVIIEKPMAMSINDAQMLIDLAHSHHVKICVCHQNRFNAAVVAAKKAIDEKRLGKISHAAISVRWNRNQSYYDQAKWRGTWEQDGGTLMNQCIHGIDLLLYLVGSDAITVMGQTRQQQHNYLEAEDVGMAVVSFENGAIATIEGTVNVFPKNLEETLYLFGDKGTIKIGGTSTNTIEIWQFTDTKSEDEHTSKLVEETSNVYGNGHSLLFKDMIDAINQNRSPLIDGEAGKRALEIVLSIYKSTLTASPIKLPLTNFSSTDMKGCFNK
ncbi:MAG: Gfo/Idh/MocA family oxidoreductase [Bacilli bacterium]